MLVFDENIKKHKKLCFLTFCIKNKHKQGNLLFYGICKYLKTRNPKNQGFSVIFITKHAEKHEKAMFFCMFVMNLTGVALNFGISLL